MKTFFALLFVVFGVLGFLVFQFGLQPKAVPIIKFSQLDNLKEWSDAVVSRTSAAIKDEPTLLIGVDPNRPEHAELALQLMKSFEQNGFKFEVVAADSRLNIARVLNTPNQFDFSKPIELLVAGIKEAEQRKLKSFLVAPSINVSHVIKEHGIHDVEAALGGRKLATISFADFPASAEREANMTWKCVADHVDTMGASDFACHTLYAARSMYSKKNDKTKIYTGWMEQTGEKDFLVYFHKN